MRVELLYFDDCPHRNTADGRLRALASTRGFELEHRRITTTAEAVRAGFRGSPTILIDGRDPFAIDGDQFGLACRMYHTPEGPAGSPTEGQLRSVLEG